MGILSAAGISSTAKTNGYSQLAFVFEKVYRLLNPEIMNAEIMNVLKIVVALVGAYGLFVSISYLLMRLIFPKIQIDEAGEEVKEVRARNLRRVSRPLRRQKNLAY
jgi:hypothetical protein